MSYPTIQWQTSAVSIIAAGDETAIDASDETLWPIIAWLAPVDILLPKTDADTTGIIHGVASE